MFQNVRKRAARRGWPIHGYVGPNGGGKSAAMLWDTIPSLEAGRPVLGTVRVLDYRNPRECDDEECEASATSGHYIRSLPDPWIIEAAFAVTTDSAERVKLMHDLGDVTGVHGVAHPLWIALTDWQQVLDARGVDLLLDEVTGAASSRESHGLPAAIANKLVQLRRNDVVVRWSSPSWARADKIIRECSQAVTYATGHMAKTVKDEGGARQWRNRRLFRWKTYDANAFEDFTVGKRAELAALTSDWHWGPKSPAFSAYDTFDSVLTVGTVTESGACYRCGGTRARPKCSCKGMTYAPVPESLGAGDPLAGEPPETPARAHGQPLPELWVPGEDFHVGEEHVQDPANVYNEADARTVIRRNSGSQRVADQAATETG